MSDLMKTRTWIVSWLVCFATMSTLEADDGLKKPLDHTSYDQWKTITGTALSRDGQWLLYSLRPGKGDSSLKIREIGTQREYVIERGSSAQFTFDNRYAVCVVQPDPDKLKVAKKANQPTAEQTQPSLLIIELSTGQTQTIARSRSFSVPRKAAGWVATTLIQEPTLAKAAEVKSRVEQVEEIPVTSTEVETTSAKAQEKSKQATAQAKNKPGPDKTESPESKKKPKSAGSVLVLKNLETGMEYRFPNVSSFRFSEDGRRLVSATSVATGDESGSDGVWMMELANLQSSQLVTGPGDYRNLTFDESGDSLAFITDRDTYKEKKSKYAVYYWKAGSGAPKSIVASGEPALRKEWEIPSSSSLTFSKNGKRLFFSTAPIRDDDQDAKKAEDDDEPPVKVDIWHWQDPWLQPMQLLRAAQERSRTYRAVVDLTTETVHQLATPEIPSITTGDEGNARFALGISDLPYRQLISWDYPGYQDAYLVDTISGNSQPLLKKIDRSLSLSPTARYATWWDSNERSWYGMAIADRKPIKLSAKIPHPVFDELHDSPSPAPGYGLGGWTDQDKEVLIYDRYDIWAVDPKRPHEPRCITEGLGRRSNVRYRYVRLDREARSVPSDSPIVLSAFNLKNKASGYVEDQVTGTKEPRELLMKEERISSLIKAQDSDAVAFTRSTFARYPDIWTSDLSFRTIKQISQANPQQLNYRWGTAELFEWKARDGKTLQGILYKPDDFKPKHKYPLLVYFYERNSDNLHRYITPSAASSSVNFSFYVSRGYVMFVPDIPYETGYPGRSAENAVLPGIEQLVSQGYINDKAIGVQGHSWGGYQVAHLVTRTNIFAAAEAGAPVSNMTSAYGGIRWSSGMSRMFQYERTQSRIGDTLWNARDLYLENSPLFHADKISTPLLILHNDKDGAVPWYQGIELFVAMRRLSKPAWLFNYNDENHGLGQIQNRRDWSVRLQQFFDHYLQGAPAPKWLTTGVPATEKGKTLGLELEEN